MALRYRTLGEFPNERREAVGTLSELLASQQPDGTYGISEDTGAMLQWLGGSIVGSMGHFGTQAALEAMDKTHLAGGKVSATVSDLGFALLKADKSLWLYCLVAELPE